jgi:hypothetical protein
MIGMKMKDKKKKEDMSSKEQYTICTAKVIQMLNCTYGTIYYTILPSRYNI